jgi:hypothetical protein
MLSSIRDACKDAWWNEEVGLDCFLIFLETVSIVIVNVVFTIHLAFV